MAIAATGFSAPTTMPVEPQPGTLLIWGGGKVPAQASQKFTGATAFLIRAKTGFSDGISAKTFANDHVIEFDGNGQLDPKEIERLRNAATVWLDDAVPATDSLRSALRDVLKHGGTVGGAVANLGVADGIAITASLDGAHDSLGLFVPQGTAVTLAGRQATVEGDAAAIWLLPPSHDPDGEIRLEQKASEPQDIVTLRRIAAARVGPEFPPLHPDPIEVPGPGSLLICGGGTLPDTIRKRFIALAGGNDAPIAFLTVAAPDPEDPNLKGLKELKAAGASHVTVLSQRTYEQVNSPEFARVLREAKAVWFVGGRQWRYLDAYQGTVAEDLFRDVLRRGGVIAGSSAGAAVQADFMVRGSPIGNKIIAAEGYEQGLKFLPGTAIDIHVSQRDRLEDFTHLIAKHPQLLGLALDEATAIEVHGHQFTVLGSGNVNVLTSQADAVNDLKLSAAAAYDLAARKKIEH